MLGFLISEYKEKFFYWELIKIMSNIYSYIYYSNIALKIIYLLIKVIKISIDIIS
jgi:hypothetical protein